MKSMFSWSAAEKRLLLGFLAINIFWFVYLILVYYSSDPRLVVKRLQDQIATETRVLDRTKTTLSDVALEKWNAGPGAFAADGNIDGYRLYLNDSLVDWSDNNISFPRKLSFVHFEAPVWTIGPYTLLADTLEKGPYTLVLFKTIHQRLSVENGLAGGGFCLNFPGRHSVFLTSDPSSIPVTVAQKTIFRVYFPDSRLFWGINQWLVMVWMIFMVASVSLLALRLLRHVIPEAPLIRSIIQSIIVFLLWGIATLVFRMITVDLSGDLFRPLVFASGLMNPNVATLMVNVGFLLVVSLIWRRTDFSAETMALMSRRVALFGAVVLTAIGFRVMLHGFLLVINHAAVPLDTHRLSSFSLFSLLIYALLFVLFLCWFLPTVKFLATLKQQSIWLRHQLLIVFVLVTVSGGILVSSPANHLFWESLLAATVYIVIVFCTKQTVPSFVSSLPETLLIIGALAALLSVYVSVTGSAKELAVRQMLAENYLVNSRDQLAEGRLLKIREEIGEDSAFKEMVPDFARGRIDQSVLTEYLMKHYFGHYFKKFSVQFTYCLSGDVLFDAERGTKFPCDQFFMSKIPSAIFTVDSSGLWYLGFSSGYKGYMSRMALPAGDLSLSVYTELVPIAVSRGIGLSEVTSSQPLTAGRLLNVYSYARYSEKQLVSHAGEFPFWRDLPVQLNTDRHDTVFMDADWSHLMLRSPDKTILVISLPARSWFVVITLFSYIFLGFSFLLLLSLALMSLFLGRNLALGSFRIRFQGTVFLLIVFTLVAIGFSSVYFIIRLNERKNISLLSDKAHSILIELQHKLSDYEGLHRTDSLYLGDLTKKFAEVFFTDINLYDSSGFLLATSQPDAFSGNLLAPYMDATARKAMIGKKQSKFVHTEQLGDWTFLSAYLPFTNRNGDLLAYLNLPAFSRQEELRSEIGSFLITFINVYAVILLIAALTGLFIARVLTRPLQLVASHLSSVKLGSSNAKIRWQGSDELALLIVEYNRMLDELDSGAVELKIREREATWREMARQVAHEIRNPLTPLSLNVQYLKRSWRENPDDFGNRLDRFVDIMQEQIDMLNTIAGDFGKYGSLPKPTLAEVNLAVILEKGVALFSFSKIAISLRVTDAPVLIQSDAGLLQVVFNNLIKNAIQSVPDNREGRISIQLAGAGSDSVEISITDNGQGISISEYDKIFTPYFTTKTLGTGIGLHLASQIVEALGGKIWFESVEGQGTAFFVRLPVNGTTGSSIN